MEPVAVALLATLLPTLLIILFLACAAIYLYTKLRANRVSYQKIELQLRTATARLLELEPPLPVTPPVWPEPGSEPPPPHPIISQDDLNPNWRIDCGAVFNTRMHFRMPPGEPLIDPFPNLEPRLEGILETIGYNYVPVELIKKLLRKRATRNKILTHIIIFAAVAKTDLEGELSFFWSISPELRRDLLKGFNALKGISFHSEFANLLSMIPAQVTTGHGAFNEEGLKRTINDLHELALPLFIDYPNLEERFIDYAFKVDGGIWLRMLISPRQLKWEWGEVSERTISVEPHLCAYTTEDGVALEEPEFLAEGETFHFAEDGTCTRQTQRIEPIMHARLEESKKRRQEEMQREEMEREGQRKKIVC